MPQRDPAPGELTEIGGPARVFVGIKIAPDIAGELAALARPLQAFSVRPVPVVDIHLTLVPPWAELSVPDAVEKLRAVLACSGPLSLAFNRVGYGPEMRWPRFLWAECDAGEELATLRAALLSAFGQNDERPFRPHVTLARLRERGRTVARKCPINHALALAQRVESVELFQSPPPGESGYRILASCRLGPAGEAARGRSSCLERTR